MSCVDEIMERRGSGVKKIFEDYTKNFKNPSTRMPKLESFPTYFRTTLMPADWEER